MNRLDRRTRIANRIINRWEPQVAKFWGVEGGGVEGRVTSNAQARAAGLTPGTFAAYAPFNGGTINFDRDFLKTAGRKDLRGAIIHELTHSYGVKENKPGQVETAADYARYMLNPAEASYWNPSADVLKWAERRGGTPMSQGTNGGGPPVGNNRRNRNTTVNNASHGATGQGYQAPVSSASAVGYGDQLAAARYSYLSQLAALRAGRPLIRQQYGADALAARQAGIANVGAAESAGISSGMLGSSADLANRAGAVGQMKSDLAAAQLAKTQGLIGVQTGIMDSRSSYYQQLASIANAIGQEQMANTIGAFEENGFGTYGTFQDYLKRLRDQKAGSAPRTRNGVGNG